MAAGALGRIYADHEVIVRQGQLIGGMAIFEREPRAATLRAVGRLRALTVDEKNFLRRINEDPSLAFHLVQTMSRRVRELSSEVARLRQQSS